MKKIMIQKITQNNWNFWTVNLTMRVKKMLTSRQIFRYAVPARTVTKKALVCIMHNRQCITCITSIFFGGGGIFPQNNYKPKTQCPRPHLLDLRRHSDNIARFIVKSFIMLIVCIIGNESVPTDRPYNWHSVPCNWHSAGFLGWPLIPMLKHYYRPIFQIKQAYMEAIVSDSSRKLMIWNYHNSDCSLRKKHFFCHLL